MKNIIRQIIIGTATMAVVLGVTWFTLEFRSPGVVPVKAATVAEFTGYAWSENIGWISMSCGAAGSTCPAGDYRVIINDDASHTLSGYAWSENIGWIKFGGLGCPSADTDGACNARLISDGGTGWEVTGWARAMAYSDAESGGWDGWISLNCENTGNCGTSDYSIRISATGDIHPTDSFAWSGNIPDDGKSFIGWIDFTGGTANTSLTNFACTPGVTYSCVGDTSRRTTTDLWCNVTTDDTDCLLSGQTCDVGTGMCTMIPPTGGTINSFSITPLIVRKGGTVTFNWNATAAGCIISGTDGSSYTVGVSGNLSSNPINANQVTFTLTCGTATETKTVRTIATYYE